jgi:hypothetical protein
MRALILTASILAAGAILSASAGTPAKADIEFPYCTSGGRVTDHVCDFYTLQQCEDFTQDVGGTCVLNPMYAPHYQTTPRRWRTHG